VRYVPGLQGGRRVRRTPVLHLQEVQRVPAASRKGEFLASLLPSHYVTTLSISGDGEGSDQCLVILNSLEIKILYYACVVVWKCSRLRVLKQSDQSQAWKLAGDGMLR
jgi:hypothetical protein